MFHKHHFYNLLVYCIIMAVFFLNYFDNTYIKFLLVNVLISIILDVVWLIANTNVLKILTEELLVHCG